MPSARKLAESRKAVRKNRQKYEREKLQAVSPNNAM